MLIFRGGNWPRHRPWCRAVTLAAVGAIVWYAVEWARSDRRPGGSSLPGFVFGVAGGLIILFEMLLWVRKQFRTIRIGRATLWLKAHLWLGLLSLPLLVLHSGFRGWGGGLAGVLMIVFIAVIVSGVGGLALQQFLPAVMREELPAETIRSQINRILAQYHDEARQLVLTTCGQEESGTESRGNRDQERKSYLIIGAVRSTGRVQGKVTGTRVQARRVPGSEPLGKFFEERVAPYLQTKHPARSPLSTPKRAAALFEEVKTCLNEDAHAVVDVLQDLCDQRRQFDRQARLHAWLHGWLCVHLPLSVALLLLMIVHVVFALRYF